MAGVDIKYKGNTIASIQATGSKTLKTQGKYCEGDITVDYTSDFTVNNVIQTAVDTDGTPYNGGSGYKEGYRLNASGNETAYSEHSVSGYIPVSSGDVIRIINIGDVVGYSLYAYGYDSGFSVVGSNIAALNPVTSGHGGYSFGFKITAANVSYIRFAFNKSMNSKVIVTKNQAISPLETSNFEGE